MIPALPPPIATVAVPRLFAPTAFAAAGNCRLGLVLQSSLRGLATLPPGPAVALGSLTHRFLSLLASAARPAPWVFYRAHGEITTRLADDPATVHYADLPRVLGSPAWSRFRAGLLDRIGEYSQTRRSSLTASQSRISPAQFGHERSLISRRLRLKGRADLISRLPDGAIEIRDFKTGNIFDATGAIEASVQVQLRCYGLMVHESFPDSPIRLVVDDGTEHEVSFAPSDQRKLMRSISKLGRELPEGRQLSASDLASPGETCHFCPVRHRCGTYLNAAPAWWKAKPPLPAAIPRDTWGEVLWDEAGIDGTFDILLRDAAGRRIRLDRLDPTRWAAPPAIGTRLWAFNLAGC
jgi:RecB family exonuclease